MKLTIKTNTLQDLLSKATKGASCNKMLPLTSLVELCTNIGTLSITTTDGNTYLRCSTTEFEGEMITVVDVTLLTSLISKLTCDSVTLEKTDTSLIVQGNGTYKIELPVDENGKEIKFPDPISNLVFTYTKTIKEEVYTTFIKSNRVALSTSLIKPCNTGYYFGDRILTTDEYVICCNDYKLVDSPILVNAECMNLVSMMKGDINLSLANDKIVFTNNNILVYSTLMNNYIADFKVDAINNLVDKEFDFKAEINRNMILSVLDRISLFISPFERNLVHLHFTEQGLEISSLQMTGHELIRYSYINPVQDYECDIDVGRLRQHIASQTGETVEIWYNNDRAIKMVAGDTTQVVALTID